MSDQHKLQAEDLIELSPHCAHADPGTAATALAILHLAEQQRTANIIAAITKWGGETSGWPNAVKDGLGIS